MRVAVVIFLFFCFHLVGKPASTHTAVRENTSRFFAERIGKGSAALEAAVAGDDYTIKKGYGDDEKNNEPIAAEDDDENETEVSARKHFRYEKYFSDYFDVLLLPEHRDTFLTYSSFFKPLSGTVSCLYLEQSVLRI